MTIQVVGVLVDPLNQPSAGTIIRVTSLDNEGDTVVGLTGSITTGSDGAYDFELVDGNHKVEVRFDDEYILTGEVVISTDTTSPIALPGLIDFMLA